eukprot:14608645-Ditylum_brightwellii.AAC.1
MSQKGSEIAELQKSIQELNLTIHAFAMAIIPQGSNTIPGQGSHGNSCSGGNTGNGGHGDQGQRKFTVKYC